MKYIHETSQMAKAAYRDGVSRGGGGGGRGGGGGSKVLEGGVGFVHEYFQILSDLEDLCYVVCIISLDHHSWLIT